MITWTEFERHQPALADAGRSPAGLHLLIKAGPKQQDLRRDRRYALHSEACPPPRHDDGFAINGRVQEVTDAETAGVVRRQVLAERDGKVWPGFDEEAIFELSLERCLLMLTQADGPFPAGPTIWKAEGMATPGSTARPDIVI
jgi:hypothetical protein